jgi:hypothetical protein
LFCCFGFLTFSGLSEQVGVFFPGNAASTEGDGVSFDPFCIEYEGYSSERFQQVYDASQFSAQAPNGGLINRILFRVDADVKGVSEDIQRIEISLSTSARSSTSLSPLFSENIGPDNSIIFPADRLLFQAGTTGGRPRPFTLEIPMNHPFFYDPKLGNLLLDIKVILPAIMTGIRSTGMDAAHNNSMATVFAPSVTATSGQVFNFGLVTLFVMTPVPEPSTWALGILGFVALSTLFSRVRGKNQKV